MLSLWTFKLRSYLNKHEQSVHKLNLNKGTATSTSSAQDKGKGKEIERTDSEDDSDWQNEPDVSVGGSESDREEDDKKITSKESAKEDLLMGRMFRKATTPAVPVTPKKRRVEEKTENDDKTRKVEVSDK